MLFELVQLLTASKQAGSAPVPVSCAVLAGTQPQGVTSIPCQQQTHSLQAGSMQFCGSIVFALMVTAQAAHRLSGGIALINAYCQKRMFGHCIPMHDSHYYT